MSLPAVFRALAEEARAGGRALSDPICTAEEKQRLVPAFLQVHGLVKQHIDSFDCFLNSEIKGIVAANAKVDSDVDRAFYLRYTDIWVGRPSVDEEMVSSAVTPQQCRLRDLTYSAPILVDVEYVRGRQLVVRQGVPIGRMPIMLRSSHCVLRGRTDGELAGLGECPLDPGGYFLTRGVERVILCQEQLAKNRVLVESDRKGEVSASVTSSTSERKSKTTFQQRAGRIYVRHNSLAEDAPVAVLLRALGMQSDSEIAAHVGGDSLLLVHLAPSLEEAADLGVHTQQQALEYLGARVRLPRRPAGAARRAAAEEGRELVADVLIAHVPAEKHSLRRKAQFVAFVVRRMLLVLTGAQPADDRDYVGNKRLELAGQLVGLLFEDLLKRFNADLKRNIDKTLAKQNRAQEFDALRLFPLQTELITQGLARAISTGTWSIRRFRMDRVGITQVLSRLSFVAALGMMTRITSQFEKTRKISGPRSLQPSQWGMLCPSDTPEGEACGLVKNLALLAHITTGQAEAQVRAQLFALGVQVADGALPEGAQLVFLNGDLLGGLRGDPGGFVGRLRRLRRSGRASPFLSVYTNREQRAVHVSCDGGRICRPLVVVDEGGRSALRPAHAACLADGSATFQDLLRAGVVEYVDVNEENDTLVAVDEQQLQAGGYTHLEIAPYSLLGAVVGLVPFPHHNQSPRNTYQCAMGKQAMGAIAHNQHERMDTLQYALQYLQHPLVRTHTIEAIRYDRLPAGQNAVVAVMSYSGYDIEDALVLNRASLDRGFGRCTVTRRHTTAVRRYANQTFDRIVAPAPDALGAMPARMQALDADGIAGPGERLLPGALFVNRQTPADTTTPPSAAFPAAGEFRATGSIYKGAVPSYVERVLLTNNQDDQLVVKTLLRQTRRPELGDKFSSRHGQKGVCGVIVAPEDLPFSDAGVVPDIVMNPHGFPSRMTVGKLLELLSGKAGALTGERQYATAFGSVDVGALGRALLAHGYSYAGKDCLTSGETGEPLEAYIYTGPVYYQKLKHMVQDKMHARARGPRAPLTRQPTEGRSRDGGLRLGEMERDCLIGHGAALLLTERLMLSSDQFQAFVCEECGLLGYAGWCNMCRSSRRVVSVRIPYACKLLFQELQSMNVVPRLRLQDL